MRHKNIVFSSLLLTIFIFTIGVLLNYGLDFVRISTIESVMSEHEVSTQAYLLETEFTDTFGGDKCAIMQDRITQLKEEVRQVGGDLSSYSRFSFFKKKDFDYLKRKYFLLEIRFLTLIDSVNKECGSPYVPILFFYEIDQDESERQGFILEEFSKAREHQVVVLSLDKDYTDEPLVQALVENYDAKKAPVLVIDGLRLEGFHGEGQIAAAAKEILAPADPYGSKHDFTYVVKAAGFDKQTIISDREAALEKELAPFAHADNLLVLGRMKEDDSIICKSIDYYGQVNSSDPEIMALAQESIAAIDCGTDTRESLLKAAELWKKAGNSHRASIMEDLAEGKKPKLDFDTSIIESISKSTKARTVTLGESKVILNSSSYVISQVDRVYRDWLGGQLNQTPFEGELLTVFSERGKFNLTELLPEVGWHEGGRLKFLSQAGISYGTAAGTIVAKHNNSWYAPNDKGLFMFQIPLDKLLYPTTRFLSDDLAVIMDTHGMNMLVEQAMRKKPDAVIACCDHPGKIKASKYMSDNGINVICLPDRFGHLALGHDLEMVTSPPMRIEEKNAIIGDQPVTFSTSEPIVVMNATVDTYALWYYTTPADYFSDLEGFTSTNKIFVQISDFRQTHKIVEKAEEIGADVIAARIVEMYDYEVFKKWIEKDKSNRLILFHSASYPYGFKMLTEYPDQVTFGDVNPRFE